MNKAQRRFAEWVTGCLVFSGCAGVNDKALPVLATPILVFSPGNPTPVAANPTPVADLFGGPVLFYRILRTPQVKSKGGRTVLTPLATEAVPIAGATP